MAVDTRPTTLTSDHNYNLRNQGWPNTFQVAPRSNGNGPYTEADPVAYTFAKVGYYPSNADIIFYSKLSVAEDPEQLGAYSPWDLKKNVFGNSPAAKGHYILPYFDKNRQIASGITGIYDPARDKINDRPVSVEFYSGRVFYLMPSGELLYSQVLTDIRRAEHCYQEADPTAEDINELIATDGGIVDIAGISRAQKIIAVGSNLALLADNGVWSISGNGNESFSAVSQEIQKISSIGCIGADTAVEVEGTVFYWSQGGVYVLASNEVTGGLIAQNLSENSIQSFYIDITSAARKNARAFYDEEAKKIFWFFNSEDYYDGVTMRYEYNRALVFDIVLKAFYTYSMSLDDTYPFIASMVQKSANSFETGTEDVTDSAVQVTDGGVDVTVSVTSPVTADVKLKLLTFMKQEDGDYRYTFSEFKNDNVLDWVTATDGIDYDSYIETGEALVGDLISEKESNTIYTFFKRTEQEVVHNDTGGLEFDYPSSCLLQAKWQWADLEGSGQWSEQQQVYRLNRHWIPTGIGAFNYGYDVVQNISQIRGKGRAISLRFESETGKDFHLLGWAIPYTMMTAA